MHDDDDEKPTLAEVFEAHRVEQLGFPGHVKCHACPDWTEGTIHDHHADLARAYLGAGLPAAVVAEPGSRLLICMGRDDLPTSTLDRLRELVTARWPDHEVSIMGGVSAVVVSPPIEGATT